MNKARVGAALCATLLLASAQGFAADEARLGRLFYTPEQRAQMSQARASRERPQGAASGNRVTLNGRVTRSDGKTTEWVNGQATPTRTPGLKVGETLDAETGNIESGVRNGRVTVNPHESR